ncbi:MAG: tripartite tricarboxylate transporter substrate-binding protein [Thiotrichaceae bacterium]|nr:tripartite tricarboxylate transporter substrate-binding protein [Thiotrichaceae bacterium]
MPNLVLAMEKPNGFPTKSLEIIVPYGQGGGSYQMASNFAQSLKTIIGVEVDVIAMPGSFGIEGTNHYMKREADGYSILQQVDIIASLYAVKKIEINPVVDLTPLAITQIAVSQIYISNLDSRFKNWPEFYDYGTRSNNKISIATVGSKESMEQLSMKILEFATSISTQQVPYDRPALRYMALVEGRVDALFEQPGDVAPFLNRKLIKPILTLVSKQHLTDDFGNTPTLDDFGLNITLPQRFRGFFINTKVDDERKKYLEWALKQAYNSDSFKTFNKNQHVITNSYRNIEHATLLMKENIKFYQKINIKK